MVRSLANIKLEVRLFSVLQNTLDDGSVVKVDHPDLNYRPSIESGTFAVSTADRGWQSVSRTLSSGGNETLDLFDFAGVDVGGGAGNDAVGLANTFEEIVAIIFVNENAVDAAGELEVEPGAANGWNPIGIHTNALGGALKGQGMLLKTNMADPAYLVVDASSKNIKMTANGGAVTYSIYVLGRSDTEESSSSSISTSSSSISTSSSSSSISTSSSSSSSSISTSSSSQSFSSSSSLSSTSSYSSVSLDESSSSFSTSSSSLSTSSISTSSL